MAEHVARLIGGAGTGKTTELLEIMERVLDAGIDPLDVGFVSFTRAARREASTRAADKFGGKPAELEERGWFKTLHAICYRALGVGKELLGPDAETRKWLAQSLEVDESEIESESDTDDAGFSAAGGTTDVGIALRLWSRARSRLEPLENSWRIAFECHAKTPPLETCESIVDRYEQSKRLDGRLDFIDLAGRFAGYRFDAEFSPRACEADGEPPRVPVWFFDEQQDTSALLDAVCRRLANDPACRWAYLVGDPFQAIYNFAGSDSQLFLQWRVDKERTLQKSFRCAAPILSVGEETLRRCSDYFDRGIAPAEHDGNVSTAWLDSETLAQIQPNEEWLLVARTNHLAGRLSSQIAKLGIPWMPTKGYGGWNKPARNAGLLGLYALACNRPCTAEEWGRALELLPSRVDGQWLIEHGAKARWLETKRAPDELSTIDAIADWGAAPLLLDRLQSGAVFDLIPGAREFVSAGESWGWDVVLSPRVRVGTIHSVKGSEADNVLFLTSSSGPIAKAAEYQEAADEERRLAYVAATRARKRLVIAHERRASHRMEVAA